MNITKSLPLFYIILAIFFASLVRQFNGINFMLWMMDFMGIFFITFGVFKLYDLNGFVLAFKEYDLIAKRFPAFGYIFPFIEITLGVMYLMGFMFLMQNLVVLVISITGLLSAISVIKSKKELECVCLGTIFKLPVSSVTLIECVSMLVMTIFMLIM